MSKLCLDFGHGGKDSGAVGHGMKEKDIVLDVGLRTHKILTNAGIDVLLTRSDDTFVGLSDRARKANSWGADLFVSLHNNSGGGYGFESFTYLKTDSKTDQYRAAIHDEVAPLFRRDRGMKQANLAVLRETRMPACLLELGFIDNAEDAADLARDDFRDKLAVAIANGILKAFGMAPVSHQDVGRPVDAGIAENVINSFLVKGRCDAHAAGNTESRDWIRLCEDELRASAGLYPAGPGRPLNPDVAQNVINSFLGPGWKDADEAGNAEPRDWIHHCANELRKASGMPTED
ncbi:N-acetylmuramoyl-L-alanine amidase [Paenibacillus larvae]